MGRTNDYQKILNVFYTNDCTLCNVFHGLEISVGEPEPLIVAETGTC